MVEANRVILVPTFHSMPRVCVYCGRSGSKITREHLWPSALHSRLQVARDQRQNHFWSARERQKDIQSEPTIRDVCDKCNNGPLSELDAYICALWDTQFKAIRARGESVVFTYDYKLLTRWLLKLCFNSSRIHKNDHFVYADYVNYILKGGPHIGQFCVFLQIVPPGSIPIRDIPKMPSGVPRVYKPHAHRIGFYWFRDPPLNQKLLRAVHLRSFSFFIAFFRECEPVEEIDFFIERFSFRRPETQILSPNTAVVTITCDGIDAWQSFRASRTELTFGTMPD